MASPCLIVVRRGGNDPIDPGGHRRTIGQVDPFEDDARAGFGWPEAKRDVGPVEEPVPADDSRMGKRALLRLTFSIPYPINATWKRRGQFWSVRAALFAGWALAAGADELFPPVAGVATALYRRLRL